MPLIDLEGVTRTYHLGDVEVHALGRASICASSPASSSR